MRRFEGKVVVVTGSGRENGLGQGILQRFADEGAACVVSDGGNDAPPADQLEAVADELRTRGADVLVVGCDVTDDTEVGGLIDATVAEFGRIDVLVNNAGVGLVMKSFLETSLAEWQDVMNVNLTGSFLVAKHAARAMIALGEGGRIINIASKAAKTGIPQMAPYCSSKHGVIGLTRSNAFELGRHGITVNAVCPNRLPTALGNRQSHYFAEFLGFDDVDQYHDAMRRRIPMGRLGMVADTAATCAWLASDDAQYVTGQAINVSGGEEVS
jgi:NAD(P)-dependent dehydrogenase (short-subunit alcohol dehydrogenase family)